MDPTWVPTPDSALATRLLASIRSAILSHNTFPPSPCLSVCNVSVPPWKRKLRLVPVMTHDLCCSWFRPFPPKVLTLTEAGEEGNSWKQRSQYRQDEENDDSRVSDTAGSPLNTE